MIGIVIVALLIRALATVTHPNLIWPDEIYQTVEPARHLVFGPWIRSWEWVVGMRSWLVPGLLAAPLWLGRLVDPTGPTGVTFVTALMVILSLTPVIIGYLWGERLQGLAPSATGYDIREARAYRIHKRIVPNYRIGRVMLAGDAAHLNAPTGGMGMNGGIHDAMNLTYKLARVLRGESPDLLDLYTRQRRPVALEEIIQQADANRKRMEDRSPDRRRAILAEMKSITADRTRHVAWLMKSSMIAGLDRAAATL